MKQKKRKRYLMNILNKIKIKNNINILIFK